MTLLDQFEGLKDECTRRQTMNPRAVLRVLEKTCVPLVVIAREVVRHCEENPEAFPEEVQEAVRALQEEVKEP